jgi:hypothetical protein
MLGPLPYLHRVAVVSAVLLTAIASGAWIAHFTLVPVAVGAGAVAGGLAGLVVAYALVHTAPPVRPQTVRSQRRR